MIDKTEILRQKARSMMFKKPIVKGLNLDEMRGDLGEIGDACSEMEYFYSGNSQGRDAIMEVLGDLDEAYELQSEFSSLGADVSRMIDELHDYAGRWFDWGEYDAEGDGRNLFDDFVCCEAIADNCGAMLGYDAYENDYFSLRGYSEHAAQEECKKRLMRMKKEDIIEYGHAVTAVVLNYVGIRYRFDCLQGVYDILRDKFGNRLKVMDEIEKAYEGLFSEDYDHRRQAESRIESLAAELPAEAWLE